MRLIDANRFQETLDKACNEPDYQHEGEDWRSGLCLAGCLLDQDSYDDFPNCSISGCEAASKTCHLKCKDSKQNKKFYDFVDFIGKYMQALYEGSSGSYKEALEDLSFEVCKYLERQGIQLNRVPLTAEYLDSNYHRDFLRGEHNENI